MAMRRARPQAEVGGAARARSRVLGQKRPIAVGTDEAKEEAGEHRPQADQHQSKQTRTLLQGGSDEARGHLISPQEEERTTPLRLSKFEKVHLLSVRACELVAGRDAKVPCAGILDPLTIALREFESGLLDARIVRPSKA